jgi:hypothetical protein
MNTTVWVYDECIQRLPQPFAQRMSLYGLVWYASPGPGLRGVLIG